MNDNNEPTGDWSMNAVIEAEPQEPTNVPAIRQSHAVASPFDVDTESFTGALARRKQNRNALMEWVREAMVEGTDYGRIHVVSRNKCSAGKHCTNASHFSKPSLFKPGAEKIAGMLGLTPTFPNMGEYERMALDGKRIETIILRCEILDARGNVVGVGMGARLVSADDGDLNKSLKMCQKSAQIDATLRTGGLSEVFTQDIEDMPNIGGDGAAEGPTVMPFGKHQGTPFTELPDDYLQWMVEKMSGKADLKAAAKAEIERRAKAEAEGDEPDTCAPPATIPFGKNAGKPWSSLSDKQLDWYADECNNAACREAAQNERDFRRQVAESDEQASG